MARTDPRLAVNREWSRRIGWSPADFGAADYDADLLVAIEKFQTDRLIEPTGVADPTTWKILLAYRAGAALSDRWRRAKAGAAGSRYRTLTARVKARGAHLTRPSKPDRLAVFRTRSLWGAHLALAAAEPPGAVVVPAGEDPGAAGNTSPLVAWFRPSLEAPWTDGRFAVDVLRDRTWAGYVIDLGPDAWGRVCRETARPVLAVLDTIEASFPDRVPRAIVADPIALGVDGAARAAQRACAIRFDGIFVPVPSAHRWSAVEVAIDTGIKFWWHRGKVAAEYLIPLIRPGDGFRVEDVHRARDWAARRRMKGVGYDGPIGPLLDAIEGPVPEIRDRIDWLKKGG